MVQTARGEAPGVPTTPTTPSVGEVPLTPAPDLTGVGDVDLSALDTGWVAAMTQMGRRIEERMRQAGATSDRAGRIQRVVGARQLMAAGMFADAVRMLSGVVEEAPDFGPAWELLARAQVAAGDPQGAVGAMEGWSTRGGGDAPSEADVKALKSAVSAEGARGYWTWLQQRLDARRDAGADISWTDYAASQAALGDADGALASLERAVEHRERALATLRSDPVWDQLRADPRFGEVARKAEALRFSSQRHPSGSRRR
jgi:tetratricopeptide (TPR) repeat protein